MKAETVDRMRTLLAGGRHLGHEELAKHFTAKTIRDALASGVILLDGDNYRSSEIDPELFDRVAAAAAVPRKPPIQSADGKMFFWLQHGQVEPFAVKRTGNGFCIVLTERGRVPTPQAADCWQQSMEYPADSFQQALIDAWDANQGFAEGTYQTAQPWRHPQADRPLSHRKP